MKKGIITSRLIYSLITTIVLFNIYLKTPNGKLILFPFVVCSVALTIKNLFLLFNKNKYSEIFNKIYSIGFLLFLFVFLIFWCYTSIINNQYSMLLFLIPFWIAGVYIIRKRFLKRNDLQENRKHSKFNFGVVISCSLVTIALVSGILMLYFGIRHTYKMNIKTKNYLITEGYFDTYEIYSADEDGVTYKLYYIYEVDNKEYSISTDYGTNYIPDKNSIREVKYNPENPDEAILIGSNSKNGLIFAGAFFVLVSSVFVIFGLSFLGFFDKFKIDVIGTYVGFVFLIIGIGIIVVQNGTTMSLIETIKSMRLWIFIPIMFMVVGVYQMINCLILNKSKRTKKK